MDLFIPANWPAPSHIFAGTTTRFLAAEQKTVESIGLLVESSLGLSSRPIWLDQKHTADCIRVNVPMQQVPVADASVTDEKGLILGIFTADCMPVLVCDRAGTQVMAIHAGWRGLQQGIISRSILAHFKTLDELLIWIGPCIRGDVYEIGPEVRDAFLDTMPDAKMAFTPSNKPNHYYLDMIQIAKMELKVLGISAVYDSGLCTYKDKRFFSYRREGLTGRLASLIQIQ